MKFFIYFLLSIFLFQMPAFSKDVVQKGNSSISGKISAYSDGIAIIESKGVSYTIEKNPSRRGFSDYIVYRSSPFKLKKTETYCRINYIDGFYVIFETSSLRVKIPRYRVSSLLINAD